MGCCKFGDEIWYCFEPESLRLVTVIDNTDHMTMAACVSLHVPQVNSMEMNFSDEVLAHLICFRQTDGQSCCDVSYVPIMRSDAQFALFSSDCGEFEVYIREKIFEDCRVFLLERIEEMLSRGQMQHTLDTEQFKENDTLYSHACDEELRFAKCVAAWNRWTRKKPISESELESAISDLNYHLRKVGGLDQCEDIRDIHQLDAKLDAFFVDMVGEYNCRTNFSQTSSYSACRFRRYRFEEESKLLSELRGSEKMQSDVISRRPVHKEDIILLAMKLGQFSRDILSSVSDRNQIHLMIFSTEEGRNACMNSCATPWHKSSSCA